jgi:hypothetical protein
VAETRWAGLSGLAFAVLFVAGMLLLGDQLGSVGDSDRQFISYFEDAANRTRDIVGGYVLAAAALSLLIFAGGLHSLVAREAPVISLVGMLAATASAVLMLVAAASLSSVSTSILVSDMFDEEPHEFGPAASRLATQIGFMALVFSMLAASLFIAMTSLASRATRLLPSWLVWLGFVASAALLLSFFFMPAAALPLWALATGLALVRTRRRGEQAP